MRTGGRILERQAPRRITTPTIAGVVVGVYEGAEGRSSAGGFSVSPNGRFVAITLVPDVVISELDAHPLAPMSTRVTTLVVATCAVLGSVDGFAASR